jgi:DUF4097 and DUF4098 domain-containing protein YvlB
MTMTSIRRFLTSRVHVPAAICLSMVTAASLSLFAFATTDEPQQKPAGGAATSTSSAGGERITVPFTDPSRPGKLIVSLNSGKILVKGHDANNVVVETVADDDDDEDRQEKGKRAGLRKIRNTASGLTIEEENNEMRVSTQMHHETALSISVPVRTSLKLTLMNGDDIVVERVEGDLEVNNMNGNISLTNVAGTGIIHSANGEIKAHFARVTGKPMSFTTMNGDVDVALPADIKATVRLDSGHGDIYTDFPIEMLPTTMNQTVQDDRGKGGKYRIKMEKAMIGKINGGGVEYTLKTMNGDIHLRRYQAGAAAKDQDQ